MNYTTGYKAIKKRDKNQARIANIKSLALILIPVTFILLFTGLQPNNSMQSCVDAYGQTFAYTVESAEVEYCHAIK